MGRLVVLLAKSILKIRYRSQLPLHSPHHPLNHLCQHHRLSNLHNHQQLDKISHSEVHSGRTQRVYTELPVRPQRPFRRRREKVVFIELPQIGDSRKCLYKVACDVILERVEGKCLWVPGKAWNALGLCFKASRVWVGKCLTMPAKA